MRTPASLAEKGRTLKDWLGGHGAQERPFEDSGTLIKPKRSPRKRSALFAACETTLLAHLKAACLWPADERNRTWRIGDYSLYVLEFTPEPGVEVYVQTWSEPDEQRVTFQASSTAWIQPRGGYEHAEKQEMLRDYGLEVGGQPHHYEKVIDVSTARDVRALAREAIAVLCRLFGYDGRQPLTYRLHLGTRLRADAVFDAICARDLAKLMRRWRFDARIDENGGKPNLITSAVGEQPFLVALVGERPEGLNEYGVMALRAFLRFTDGIPDGFANSINQDFLTVKAGVDADGDLIVQMPVLLHGGLTEANLEMSFQIWKQTLEEIVKGLE